MRLPAVLATAALAAGCATAPAASPRTPSAAAAPAAPDTVRVDGSPGVAPLVAALARAYAASHPTSAIVMGGGLGTQARIQALAEGRIDIAMASHGVDVPALARRGIAVHEVAKVAVVFAVHAGVPVTELTERQLCDVYAGTVDSWRQLGGPDLAVAPRTRPPAEVDAEVALAGIACLRGVTMAAGVKVVERPEAMAAELAATAGAVGMTSMPFVEQSGGRIRALALNGVAPGAASLRSGAYPLVRRSYLLTPVAPTPAVARFLAFVRSPAGERVILASGAVPAS